MPAGSKGSSGSLSMKTFKRWIETAFETFLFNSRLVVILAVIGSLTSSVLMFVRGALMIWHTAKDFVHHFGDPHSESEELSIALISSVDSFLFATVLLIFAMGIYELFISKIDPASRTEESRPNWLQIHSLDDLKSAVGKVILMILIVRLFESAVKMKYETPLHLLYLGLAVLFVAGALFLQHVSHKHDKHAPEPKHATIEAPPVGSRFPTVDAHHPATPFYDTPTSASVPIATVPPDPFAPNPHGAVSAPPHPYAQPTPTLAPPQGSFEHPSQLPFPAGPTAPRAY